MKFIILLLLIISITGCSNNIKSELDILAEYDEKYKQSYNYETMYYQYTLNYYNNYSDKTYKENNWKKIKIKGITEPYISKNDFYIVFNKYEQSSEYQSSILYNNNTNYFKINDGVSLYSYKKVYNKYNNDIIFEEKHVENDASKLYCRTGLLSPDKIGRLYYFMEQNKYNTKIIISDNNISINATFTNEDQNSDFGGIYNNLFIDEVISTYNIKYKVEVEVKASLISNIIVNEKTIVKFKDINGNVFGETIITFNKIDPFPIVVPTLSNKQAISSKVNISALL